MSDTKYAYAVARIRALENGLFSSAQIEQLLSVKSYEGALRFLTEHGWGDADTPLSAEAILTWEKAKSWETVRDLLKGDDAILAVLSYGDLYHNLKAAIKDAAAPGSHGNVYFDDCEVDGARMAKIVAEKDWQALPAHMREAAKEASETFLHTGDGQLCDIIVDRAALAAIYECGKNASDAIIRDYAETTVAVADIKIAVRSQKTGKHLDFMRRAMAPCDSLNIERLSQAALGGVGAICEYLEGTRYGGGAQALKESPSAFERWCDNQLIETIKPQKYNPFTAGPLVAYVLAKENEIKTVRIILTARLNGLEEEQIRERIRRCMYKVAVVGDYDSIYGFAALGLETFPVSDVNETEKVFLELASGSYAVIYITEAAAAGIETAIDRYREQPLPSVILIPGISGNTGKGVESVKHSVEQAVGSDILFGDA